MITLSVLLLLFVLGLAAVLVIALVLAVIGLPVLLLWGLLPWLLRVAGVVLLLKALFQKPVRWENYVPAVGVFTLSIVLGWLL